MGHFEDNKKENSSVYNFFYGSVYGVAGNVQGNQNISTSEPKLEEVELRSERGVDYTKLRNLLAAQKWKEADQETVKVMFEAAGMTSEGKLRGEHIDNFPCKDLRTINQLWLYYSGGWFGFSVQKKIYNGWTLVQVYNPTVWEKVGDEFGWRQGGNWLNPEDLTFNLLDAPKGHLPWFLCGYVEDGFLLSRRDL